MAADVPAPDPSWSDSYVIMKGHNDEYPYRALVFSDCPNLRFYIYQNSSGANLLKITTSSGDSPFSDSASYGYSDYDFASSTWMFYQTMYVTDKKYSGTAILYNGGTGDYLAEPLDTNSSILVSYKENPTDSDWAVFRVAPPLVDLTEELIQMIPVALDLDGKLKILVPFGISCLALLISLPLLLKVLRRFLA